MFNSPERENTRLDRPLRPGMQATIVDLLSLEYYPLGSFRNGTDVREMNGWTFRSRSELRDLVLSFARGRNVEERQLFEIDRSQILEYMRIIARYGASSAAAKSFRAEREDKKGFQAACDASDFIRREYCKFSARRPNN